MSPDMATSGDHSDAQSRPRLSVVMPAHNAAPYIGRAISSILNQTFEDLELIIVNDGSSDGTVEIIEHFASTDSRIRVIHNERNLGEAAAYNRGIGVSRARLVGRMDADDISLPTRFERQVAEYERDDELAVLGTFASHTNDREEVLSLSKTGPTTKAEFEELRRNGEPTLVFGGTAIFSRQLYDKVGGYDATLTTAADLDFCDRMAEHGVVRAIPEPLLLYRVHPGSNVMRRFFEGRRTHRYIRARRAAQLAGREPITREEYVQWEHAQSRWWRLRTRLGDIAQYHYRSAGIAYANRMRVRMVGHLVVAVVTNPGHVLRRLWDQRLAPSARKARREVSFAEDSLS